MTFGLFTEAMAFFGTSAHEGKCEEPLTFMGTSGHSIIIVPGEFDALTNLTMSEEFRELYTKVIFAVPDVAAARIKCSRRPIRPASSTIRFVDFPTEAWALMAGFFGYIAALGFVFGAAIALLVRWQTPRTAPTRIGFSTRPKVNNCMWFPTHVSARFQRTSNSGHH